MSIIIYLFLCFVQLNYYKISSINNKKATLYLHRYFSGCSKNALPRGQAVYWPAISYCRPRGVPYPLFPLKRSINHNEGKINYCKEIILFQEVPLYAEIFGKTIFALIVFSWTVVTVNKRVGFRQRLVLKSEISKVMSRYCLVSYIIKNYLVCYFYLMDNLRLQK